MRSKTPSYFSALESGHLLDRRWTSSAPPVTSRPSRVRQRSQAKRCRPASIIRDRSRREVAKSSSVGKSKCLAGIVLSRLPPRIVLADGGRADRRSPILIAEAREIKPPCAYQCP